MRVVVHHPDSLRSTTEVGVELEEVLKTIAVIMRNAMMFFQLSAKHGWL